MMLKFPSRSTNLLGPLATLLGVSLLTSMQVDLRLSPFVASFASFLVLWFSDRATGHTQLWSSRLWQIYVLATSSVLALLFSQLVFEQFNSETIRFCTVHGMLVGSAFLALYYGDEQRLHGEESLSGGSTIWNRALIITLQILILRVISNFLIELISEEAYYWKYSENLALSYLDHPPLVAWCIRAGELLFGTTEFGVRSVGILCWLGVVYFTVKITRSVFPHASLPHVVMIATLLPFPLSIGFFMTPDTPLALAWSATLFFLYQVFFEDKKKSWFGVGISLGCALLAKYPAVLLGIGIPLFMAVDRDSRRHFLSPLPYLAAMIALCIFSPVVVWNYQNSWASFAFQSTRRFSAEKEFSTHIWFLFLVLSLTPIGAKILFDSVKGLKKNIDGLGSTRDFNLSGRIFLFISIFTFVPVFAFGYASLSQEIKVNWLGPATLVCIPLFAYTISSPSLQRRYLIQWSALGVLFSTVLHVAVFLLVIGLPGVSPPKAFRKFTGWEELAQVVESKRHEIAVSTRLPVFVAGGDSHYVASELGFYRKKIALEARLEPPQPSQGRELFNKQSLMYSFWTHPADLQGSTIITVSRTENDLNDSELAKYFQRLDPLERIEIKREGKPLATFFMRVGFNYTSFVQESEK